MNKTKKPAQRQEVALYFVLWTSNGRDYHIVNLNHGQQAVASTFAKAKQLAEEAKKELKHAYEGIYITSVVDVEGKPEKKSKAA